MEKRIAIVGAGISGLLACKYAMEKGFNPIVFEARSSIGGVWSRTIESTKLQTPISYYRFSDFAWASSVTETFPNHNQVMEYLKSYALHFNILPQIRFSSRVISIDYFTPRSEDFPSWDLWGGTGEPFSPTGKWNITVKVTRHPLMVTQVYEVDFVILCIGKYSDLPNIPDFPINRRPDIFDGKVIHSMDYAAMGGDLASEFIKEKRVTVVGLQKSAVDVAAEVATRNVLDVFKFWMFSKLVETYLKWTYPLKKYNMVPKHPFLKQIVSCMSMVIPANFYDRVREGSLILKKAQSFSFCRNGLVLDGEAAVLETDIVIFATGYKSDEKLSNIFTSTFFKNCITGSSAPFYRECIHPRIPQLAILGYSESPSVLYTMEVKSMWLAHFLAGNFKLPPVKEMEDDVMKWEKCIERYAGDGYKRSCVSVLLQIHVNDQLCRDMGCNPRRKRWFLPEMFAAYGPMDYANLTWPGQLISNRWRVMSRVLRPRIPNDPRSCQMNGRTISTVIPDSAAPAKGVRTGCPDTPSDGFVSHGKRDKSSWPFTRY